MQADLTAANEAVHSLRSEADQLKQRLRDSVSGNDARDQRIAQLEGQLQDAEAAVKQNAEVTADHEAAKAAADAVAEAHAQAERQLVQAR